MRLSPIQCSCGPNLLETWETLTVSANDIIIILEMAVALLHGAFDGEAPSRRRELFILDTLV